MTERLTRRSLFGAVAVAAVAPFVPKPKPEKMILAKTTMEVGPDNMCMLMCDNRGNWEIIAAECE